ncbi:MAG: hypothetical protein EOP56_10275 [Sphingobacteriales bacterium]|nr:MAG: hypothetical protein EOP56_10275 [Sphingobacteriales bacterium]
MNRHLLIIALFALLGFAACQKDEAGNTPPSIDNLVASPNTVRNGDPRDTVYVTFKVTDQNGDLGNDPYKKEFDVYLKDSRDGNETGFPFPEIPKDLQDARKGITAFATIKINAGLFLQLRQDRPDGDTMYYEVYVKDRAGNISNKLSTQLIYITPQ